MGDKESYKATHVLQWLGYWYGIRYASNRLYLWACRPSMLQRWIKDQRYG
jgi:hypothetical protein